ncbi:MAG: 4Fe-4S binding protein [Candidatus Thermoplasmatota archaeon]
MPIARERSTRVKTGFWRTFRPVLDPEKCIKCYLCWKFCPDVSVKIGEDSYPCFDYEHCKGCGICSHECPKNAIEMALEE